VSLHFFFVPAARPGTAQDELNLFLAQERVSTLTRRPTRSYPAWPVANRKNPGVLVGAGQGGPCRTPPGCFVVHGELQQGLPHVA
jgi:hypothetical protein